MIEHVILSSFRKRCQLYVQNFLFLILFFLFIYLIYSPLFKAPLYQDDPTLIAANSWIQQIPPGTWYLQLYSDSSQIAPGYRPTTIMSYWLNHALIPGQLEFSLRIGNLLLLIFNGFLLTMLSKYFFKERWIGMCIGLFYILHPIQTLSIVYLWKRSTLLCATFILIGINSLIAYHQTEKNRDIKFWTIQLLCFAGALTSKQEGIIYPIVLGLCQYVLKENSFERTRLKSSVIWFFAITAILTVLLIRGYTQDWIWNLVFQPDRLNYLRKSLQIMPSYWLDMIWPHPLLFGEATASQGWFHGKSILTILFFIISVWIFYKSDAFKVVKIALVFLWVGFLPNSTMQPLLLNIDQIRMYIPLAGFAILVGFAVTFIRKKRVRIFILMVICGVYAVGSFQQSIKYLQPAIIFSDIVETYPKSTLAWDLLATTFENESKFALAAKAFQKSYDIDPSFQDELIRSLTNRVRAGEPISKIDLEYKKIKPVQNQNKYFNIQMAVLQMELQRLDEAEKTMRDVLESYPSYAQAHYILGLIFEKKMIFNLAKQAYQNALILNPNNQMAKDALARLSGPKNH